MATVEVVGNPPVLESEYFERNERMAYWNLDDDSLFVRVLRLEIPWADTWADTRDGHTDKQKRERLRAYAREQLGPTPPDAKWWAFRISVRKKRRGGFDIDNVPKIIIDAFCLGQITEDKSEFTQLALYPEDNLDYVRVLCVYGERAKDSNSTLIEVFAFVGDESLHDSLSK